jgi:4-hydroxyphenylpyruvate dioxygenase
MIKVISVHKKGFFCKSHSYEPKGLESEEMGRHLAAHGDGVKDVAFAVEDLDAIMERAKQRGVKVVKDIWQEEDEVCLLVCFFIN